MSNKLLPDPTQRENAMVSRRQFVKASALAAGSISLASIVPAVAFGANERIRIGVIGCGGRGTGAVADALGAATKVIYPQAGYHTEDLAADAKLANKNRAA